MSSNQFEPFIILRKSCKSPKFYIHSICKFSETCHFVPKKKSINFYVLPQFYEKVLPIFFKCYSFFFLKILIIPVRSNFSPILLYWFICGDWRAHSITLWLLGVPEASGFTVIGFGASYNVSLTRFMCSYFWERATANRKKNCVNKHSSGQS